MHVCAAVRNEAQKLFWSCPDTWYLVPGSWLQSGGLAGRTHGALDAMGYFKQIEVNFETELIPDIVWEGEMPKLVRDFREEKGEDQIKDFWQVLQHRLPCATHVVLSETMIRDAREPMSPLLQKVAEACPNGVSMYASFLQAQASHERRLERHLCRHIRSNGSATASRWERVVPAWTKQSVLPPRRVFRGLVGAYSH